MHALDLLQKNYRKYRWFFTRSGKLVIGGKSATQNDELLEQITALSGDYLVMHTAAPGSPFCVILAPLSSITKADRTECAVFTGCFSRAWRDKKTNATIDIFLSSQFVKTRTMKTGTWGVKTRVERMNVQPKLALTRQHSILRAVPLSTLPQKKVLAIICPGTLGKDDIATKLELEIHEHVSQEEVLAALPAGGSRFCSR